MPRLLPEVGPDGQLNMLDSLMAISGAQIHHLIMVRQCLKDGLPLAAYSTPELAKLTSRSERTVRVAKIPQVHLAEMSLKAFAGGLSSDVRRIACFFSALEGFTRILAFERSYNPLR